MKIFFLSFLVLLAGCTPNLIRVTEFDGSALPIPGMSAVAGGCQVSTKGEVKGVLMYKNNKCVYFTFEEQSLSIFKVD